MSKVIYRTATSFDGFIADDKHSLNWLFTVDHEHGDDHDEFLRNVGVFVEGSSTYEWILRETDMLAGPRQWQRYYGTRPTFVFTSRELPRPAGADVRFRQGAIGDHLIEIDAAAEGLDVWVVGGGDLAGQFLDAGALDEISLTIAPVALGAGAPLLPRRIESDELTLVELHQHGQFAELVLEVRRHHPSAIA